ncbi:MAG: hypothetical protein H8D78_17580 [Chloroflexi bacterium]|nr:hypothetical protein [Chloroflexota bacterium]
MTGSGGFHIVDEISLFAVTESAAKRGAFDTNAIGWMQWTTSPGERLGAFGPDGDVFSKKGPALALLAVPLYWLMWALPGVGLLQGTLLFNMLVTAATALLVWRTVLALGYAQRTGVVAALLYGLGTMAWPYATHFFGEPLSALSLLAMFYTLLRLRQSGRSGYAWATGLAAGLLIAGNAAHAVVLPFFLLYLAQEARGKRQEAGRESHLHLASCILYLASCILVPLIAAVALLAGYNWVRFGHLLQTGYHFEAGEGFNGPLLQGLWGLLLSPYRGLFWYTPLAVAALLSWPRFITRHKEEGWLLAAVSGALVLLFSCWWMWWAGFAWGPRFLVPLMPFLVVVLAPVLERCRGTPCGCPTDVGVDGVGAPLAVALIILILLSVAVQLLAVSVNYVNYEMELREKIYPTDWADPLRYGPPALYNPWHSPVLGQVRLWWRGFLAHEDLAWVQAGAVQWDVVVAGLAVLALAGVTLGLALRQEARSKKQEARGRRQEVTRILHPASCILLVLAALAFAGFVLVRYAADPVYGQAKEGYAAILDEIAVQAGPDDAIVTVAPYHYHIPMNRYRGRLPIYGYAQEGLPLHAETERVLRRVLNQRERIWFVTAGLRPSDENNGIEAWLAEHAFQAGDRWYGDFRLLPYGTADELTPLPVTARFGSAIELESAAIGPSQAGSILAVESRWRAREPVKSDLVVFLQLLDAEGRLRAQRDGRPRGGYAPVATWRPGQVIVDRQGLLLPSDLPPGEYTLIAGWYEATSLERLPVWSRDGEPLGDHLMLGRVMTE